MNTNIVKEKLCKLETPSIMIDSLNATIICIDNYEVCCKKYLELSVHDNSTIIVEFPNEELTNDLIIKLVKDTDIISKLLDCLIEDNSLLDFDAFKVDWDKFLNEVEDK